MTGVITVLIEAYNAIVTALPSWAQSFISLFLFVLLIVIYSVFIWKFYRFLGTKNLLQLDLHQYNKSEHPFFSKLVAGILYLIEYLIILPFLVFFWFAIFTGFLIVLTENIDVQTILLMSAMIIGAIRVTSYIPNYGEALSKELAKLVPFALLAFGLINANVLSNAELVLTKFQAIPPAFGPILTYLSFIFILEIVLRFFDFIFSLFGLEEIEVEETEN
jgi:hypothetical protein